MMKHETTILDSIGNTPLIELCHVVPDGCARVLVKLESHNPTGSMKDRMARAVIGGAVSRGELVPGGTVVEYTGGSTGTSLAFVCAAMGYRLSIVTSDAFQFNNPDAASGYVSMAEEIWNQSDRRLGAFVQSVGTAQCITGVAGALRERNKGTHIAAVEPSESPVLAGGAPGSHKIEGVGPGFVPPESGQA